MSYGAKILDLKKVIQISQILKDKAIEKYMGDTNNNDLEEYRDYQMSVLHYLNELKEKIGIK